MALPEPFLRRLEALLPPADLAATLAALDAPPATGFRVNTLRAADPSTADADVLAALAADGLAPHPVPLVPHAYWVEPEHRAALLASAPYREGAVYVQNLSSQLPPVLLAPQPGEAVLDLCAAPGSKTGQIAALMRDDGEIAAVEKVRPRFFKLRDNLEQQGATAVRTFLRDGQTVWRHRPEHFDRVLVDAPCSTEGRFSSLDPDTTAFWSEGKAKEMARKQGKLLWSGLQALRPGGTLVYATCTFAPEENEAVVDRALRTFGDAVEVVPLELGLPNARPGIEGWGKKTFDPAVRGTARVLPTQEWEAFYVAKLVKHASTLPDARR